MPTERMGPAARSFAADAHDCIMVRIQTDLPNTSLRRKDAPNGELPSDYHADRRRQTPELRREAHLAVHRPSACSGVKALRNTSDATAASRQAALAFRSLDPFRAR